MWARGGWAGHEGRGCGDVLVWTGVVRGSWLVGTPAVSPRRSDYEKTCQWSSVKALISTTQRQTAARKRKKENVTQILFIIRFGESMSLSGSEGKQYVTQVMLVIRFSASVSERVFPVVSACSSWRGRCLYRGPLSRV